MSKRYNSSQQGGVPEGALPRPATAVPVQAITPEWTGSIPVEVAEQLANLPGYENDANVQAFRALQASSQGVMAPAQNQAETTLFEEDVFGPRTTPMATGSADTEVNPVLNELYNTGPAVAENLTIPESVVSITGGDIKGQDIETLAKEQARRSAQVNRSNNMAARIAFSEDLDTSLKAEKFPLASRERATRFIANVGDSLMGVEVLDPKIGAYENGLGRILNKINEGETDSNNLITSAATTFLVGQALVRSSKMLAGKANRESLPEEDVLGGILEASGLSSISEVGTPAAFHDERGLVGIKEGSLGANLLQGISDSVRQARGSNKGIAFDPNDAAVIEQALVDGGYLVPAPYIVKDSSGKPTKKRKELAEEHTALFMTRKLYDSVNGMQEVSELAELKLGAQAITTPDGMALGEGAKYAPGSKRKPKGLPSQAAGANKDNVFTSYDKTLRKSFRAHDEQVLAVQAVQLSALQTYLQTPIDQRDQLPEQVKILALDMAIQHKIKTERVDPRSQTKRGKLSYYNAMQKVGNVSKNIGDAANLQSQLPQGHRIGGAMWADKTTNRNYITAYNSSEHNKAHRSSLRGHDRHISRSKILNSTSPTTPLITQKDLDSLRTLFKGNSSRTQAHDETAFLLSAGRSLIPNSGTTPDSVLIRQITPANLAMFANLSNAFSSVAEVAAQGENLKLVGSNPEKLTLDPQVLQNINASELQASLDLATAVDKKHAGQTQQLLNAVSSYINAGENSTVKLHSIDLADMKAASRLLAATHAGSQKGAQLVRYMGWFITESTTSPESNQPIIDGVDHTTENTRMFTIKNILDILESSRLDQSDSGESGGTERIVIDVLNSALITTKAPQYADTIAKLSNMVLEYGMGLTGSTEAMLKGFGDFLTEFQNDHIAAGLPQETSPLQNFNDQLYAEGFTQEDVVESLFDVFSRSLMEVANLGYAQSMQKVFMAGAMLNIPAVFTGYDGQKFPIGRTGRKPIYGETVIIKGQKSTQENPSYSEVQDLPAAPADSKFIEAEGTFNEPMPYSAVAQAAGPAHGHNVERALVTATFDTLQERLGEHRDIILDIHDAVGLPPLEGLMFSQILNTESTRKVLQYDLPRHTTMAVISDIEFKLAKLLRQDSMILGPDSEYAELTDWFDRSWENLISDNSLVNPHARHGGAGEVDSVVLRDKKALASRKRRLLKTKNVLAKAKELGLWSPKEGGLWVLGTKFESADNSTQSSFSVDPKAFVAWYVSNILKEARNGADTELLQLGHSVQNLVEDMANVDPDKSMFMRSGRD